MNEKANSLSKHLAWIDLEMTGLDPHEHRIIEIACVVTDNDLNVVAEGPNLVVHQPEEELAKMDAWCVAHHGASGLTERVRKSQLTPAQAEQESIRFFRQYMEVGEAPLCGNSIGQDRKFLEAWMPELGALFHYRSIDVSTLKELAKRWRPELPSMEKKGSHRALDDILESIEELRYYRQHLLESSS